MTKKVIAVYNDFPTANAVVRTLVDNGISRKEISMITLDEQGNYKKEIMNLKEIAEPEGRQGLSYGVSTGAGIGAILGGLGGILAGLGVFIIPGLGPVLAVGPLAAALTGLAGGAVGAVSGGVVGGLIGAFTGMGVPEEKAELYLENIRHGGVLVAVHVEDYKAPGVRVILDQFNPVEIEGDDLHGEGGETLAPPVEPAGEQQKVEEKLAYDLSKANAFNPENQTYSVEALTDPSRSYIATEYDQGFQAFDQDYRQHYAAHLADSGNPYDYYLPSYQYGYALAADERYRHMDWGKLEPQAQEIWQSKLHSGAWEEVRDAVRFAWEDVRAEME